MIFSALWLLWIWTFGDPTIDPFKGIDFNHRLHVKMDVVTGSGKWRQCGSAWMLVLSWLITWLLMTTIMPDTCIKRRIQPALRHQVSHGDCGTKEIPQNDLCLKFRRVGTCSLLCSCDGFWLFFYTRLLKFSIKINQNLLLLCLSGQCLGYRCIRSE